jgi:hypothetical protein
MTVLGSCPFECSENYSGKQFQQLTDIKNSVSILSMKTWKTAREAYELTIGVKSEQKQREEATLLTWINDDLKNSVENAIKLGFVQVKEKVPYTIKTMTRFDVLDFVKNNIPSDYKAHVSMIQIDYDWFMEVELCWNREQTGT